MIDSFDDLGDAKKPYKVVAVIPVHGRIPLLIQTIRRLYLKNDVYKVICVGDGHEEKKTCEHYGAFWVSYKNKPLGDKWNKGFIAAKIFNPDAVLYVGSSDWISDNWIKVMRPYVDKHDLTGTLGNYYCDLGNKIRLCYWPGYENYRKGETIGIGRMLSKRLLDLLEWKPFDDSLDSSLDGSMKKRSLNVGVKDFEVNEPIKSLSISTDKWDNLHRFNHHWLGSLPSVRIEPPDEFLKLNFPEAFTIFS